MRFLLLDSWVCKQQFRQNTGLELNDYLLKRLEPSMSPAEVQAVLHEIGNLTLYGTKADEVGTVTEEWLVQYCSTLDAVTVILEYSPDGKLLSFTLFDD